MLFMLLQYDVQMWIQATYYIIQSNSEYHLSDWIYSKTIRWRVILLKSYLKLDNLIKQIDSN